MVYVALVVVPIPATRAAIMFTITLIIWQVFTDRHCMVCVWHSVVVIS